MSAVFQRRRTWSGLLASAASALAAAGPGEGRQASSSACFARGATICCSRLLLLLLLLLLLPAFLLCPGADAAGALMLLSIRLARRSPLASACCLSALVLETIKFLVDVKGSADALESRLRGHRAWLSAVAGQKVWMPF
jgi:hypothetical protein